MNKIAAILIVFLIGVFGVVFSQRAVIAAQVDRLIYYSPCDTPLYFKLGEVDKRFDLSNSEMIGDSVRAAKIWNGIVDKEILVYSPRAELTINFTYDERQALDDEIRKLQGQVQKENKNLKPELDNYDQMTADFNRRVDDLNKRISYWNGQGGASEEEYKKLVSEQESLKKEADSLNEMARSLNISTDSYNSQVNKLNQTVDSFKSALEEKPEEGIFDGPNNRIDIYFSISQNELIHTLAHEMGHALGLGHIPTKKSIMYPFTNQEIRASADDVAAIQQLCQKVSVFDILYQRIKMLRLAGNF